MPPTTMTLVLFWSDLTAFMLPPGYRWVPDWEAIGAIGDVTAAPVGLLAIAYSIRALRRQLRHQSDLEAKRLEEEQLLRVMAVAQVPYDATHDFVAGMVRWKLTGESLRNPRYWPEAVDRVVEAHRQFSTATATAMSILRRSRPRRFPRGTQDQALARYEDLMQKVTAENIRLIEYAQGNWSTFDLAAFQKSHGSDAFEISNALRRVTADLLARMYSEGNEWEPFEFKPLSGDDAGGNVTFDFADRTPLGRR